MNRARRAGIRSSATNGWFRSKRLCAIDGLRDGPIRARRRLGIDAGGFSETTASLAQPDRVIDPAMTAIVTNRFSFMAYRNLAEALACRLG